MFLILFNFGFGQINNSISSAIDTLLIKKSINPFNGAVLITNGERKIYENFIGFSDFESKRILTQNDSFVIGSVSKQFTASLVLIEYDKGNLDLSVPIKKYLPEIKQNWADLVTVHHLLTHMHGIESLDKPLLFEAGTKYLYSQIGYDLLAKILEKITGKEFSSLSQELFQKCGMKNTFHPDFKINSNLVKGYTKTENKGFDFETNTFQNYPAAGSFISTAEDLHKWNSIFFEGKLFKKRTFKLLITKHKGAIRQHPVFGLTEYGYGTTIDIKEGITQYGQTGFAPGFVSMNFYFPNKKISVIVLQNAVCDLNDLKNTFFYHTEVLKIIRKNYDRI